MELTSILKQAIEIGASDIFLVVGQPISFKIKGNIEKLDDVRLTPKDTMELVEAMYELSSNRQKTILEKNGDDDFALSFVNLGRFRTSVYRQRGSLSAVMRVVYFSLPAVEDMGIPQMVLDLGKYKQGLILVTGPAGSGKSTTLSYIIDQINRTRNCHIITLEDPIEFLHKHNKSIVSQREISIDTISYNNALRAAMRQSPDVLLVGEMRDAETISMALTAAETGHLVLSTLHTIGAGNTIDRIIDTFPSNQQSQVKLQLSTALEAVVSQQLLPSAKHGQVPAFEIMKNNNTLRPLIRDGKISQIDTAMHTNPSSDMISMDSYITILYKNGIIDYNTAMIACMNSDTLRRTLGLMTVKEKHDTPHNK